VRNGAEKLTHIADSILIGNELRQRKARKNATGAVSKFGAIG